MESALAAPPLAAPRRADHAHLRWQPRWLALRVGRSACMRRDSLLEPLGAAERLQNVAAVIVAARIVWIEAERLVDRIERLAGNGSSAVRRRNGSSPRSTPQSSVRLSGARRRNWSARPGRRDGAHALSRTPPVSALAHTGTRGARTRTSSGEISRALLRESARALRVKLGAAI